jgi:hypothetical protein
MLREWLLRMPERRPPDFIIGGEDRPYLLRWWIIPRNPIFNVYLHCFLRDDDDRALHDHPWIWCSILLRGSYLEYTEAGIQRFDAGSIRTHRAKFSHRLALIAGAHCWTLFITGPRIRNWGFHCPDAWVPWEKFTAADRPGEVGKGCEQ